MPTGVPHYGHIPPYDNIRVDSFTTPRTSGYSSAYLFLLTHAHSDHLGGLAAKGWGCPVYCSADTKSLVLSNRRGGPQSKGKRSEPTYGHLEGLVISPQHSKDDVRCRRKLLNVLEMDKPTVLDCGMNETVTVTAIDANHCPGSVMYLVEGEQGAVLHTGDVRCEMAHIERLKDHPQLQPYFLTPGGHHAVKQLDAIYLDTACVMCDFEVPAKAAAVEGLVSIVQKYPEGYRFFFNVWTLGWEDVLIGIAAAFNCSICVDEYKYSQYVALSDPVWRKILTTDPTVTRFHACERFDRCKECAESRVDVVYVHPQDMPLAQWQFYLHHTLEKLRSGTFPDFIKFGMSRHSPRSELKDLVGLFKPKRVVPSTVYPNLKGQDWVSLPRWLRDVLPHSAPQLMWDEMKRCGVGLDLEDVWFDLDVDHKSNARVADMSSFALAVLQKFAGLNPHLAKVMDAPEFDLSVFLKRNFGAIMRDEEDGATTDEGKGLHLIGESQDSAGSWGPPKVALSAPLDNDENNSPKPTSQFLFTVSNPTESQDADCEPSPPDIITLVVPQRRSAFPRDPPSIIIAPPSSPPAPTERAASAISRSSSVASKDTKQMECKAYTIAELLGLDPNGPPPPLPPHRQRQPQAPSHKLANPLAPSDYKRAQETIYIEPELELAQPQALMGSQPEVTFQHLGTSSFPSILSSGRSINLRGPLPSTDPAVAKHPPKATTRTLKQVERKAADGLRMANSNAYGRSSGDDVDEPEERRRKIRKIND